MVVSESWFGPTFHRITAPVTNPLPLAVMGKPPDGTLPNVAVAGLRNVRNDEEVCVVKFVLYSLQPMPSPNTMMTAAINQLREGIQERSSRAIYNSGGLPFTVQGKQVGPAPNCNAGSTQILRELSGC